MAFAIEKCIAQRPGERTSIRTRVFSGGTIMQLHQAQEQPVLRAPLTEKEKHRTADTVAGVIYEGPEAIEKRLADLDREWTAGRVIKVAAGLALVAGLALATLLHPAWLVLPVIVGLLLLEYAVRCDSVLTWLLRSAGFRTSKQIEHERIALKALRGDFRNLPTVFDKA